MLSRNCLPFRSTRGHLQDRQYNGLELEDTKGIIRSRKSKDRQYYDLELEDTKGVIRIRKSTKDRQHYGQKKKDRQHYGQKKKPNLFPQHCNE
jgi:hypothetical protein